MRLTPEQIGAIQREGNKYKEAVAEASKAQVALWEARFDLAIAMGEVESIEDLLKPASWGNGGCNCAATPDIGQIVEPVR